MAVVAAEGVVKTFGEGRAARRVLDGASLHVAAGEVVAILGRSGTGKSTLLHLVGGLDRPEAGVISVDGTIVTGASERALSRLRRTRIGFVFQFFHLLPELSGEANVLLAGRVRGAAPEAADRGQRADRPARPAAGRRIVAAPAQRRRAAALRDRAGAGQRPGAPAGRRADGQPRRCRPAPRSCGCCAPAPTRAARSSWSRTRRRRRTSPTASSRCATAAWSKRDRAAQPRRRAAPRAPRAGVIRDASPRCAPRGRTWLAALGVLAASLVVGTATTVGYSLATGFDRAAERSDLPDILARFTRAPRDQVDARVSALPNLAARSYRNEQLNQRLSAGTHRTGQGAVTAVLGGRRGYLIIDGRDLRDGEVGEAVIERGLAREWDRGRRRHDRLAAPRARAAADRRDRGLARQRRVPARQGRPRLCDRADSPTTAAGAADPANMALLWLNDPSKADVTLTQARAVTFGLGKLQFITRTGVKILLSQAAGIVISLLVAFSLVALLAAGTMLAAGAHADVQRRLTGFGVQRALGFGPGRIAAQQAVEAALVAVPAATLGIALGALLVAKPAADLLAALNEVGPGATLLAPLAARRAARGRRGRRLRRDLAGLARRAPPTGGDPPRRRPRPPAAPRRAARLRRDPGRRRRRRRPVRPRRAVRHRRAGALVRGRRDDRGLRGRGDAHARARVAARAAARGPGHGRQALPARGLLDPVLIPEARRLPGVHAWASGTAIDAADSFRLGEPSGSSPTPATTRDFENPPLAEGRRIRGPNEVEVGLGMADALGLQPGIELAAQIPDGGEVRFRVTGIVRALENDGRIAWVQPDKLLEPRPDLSPQVVVRVKPGADPAAVTRELPAGPRRAPPARRRRADRQRRVPRRARRGAARRRPGRRPRLPVRADPGADRHRARAPRRGRAAARGAAPTRPSVGLVLGGRRDRGRDPRRDRGRRARAGRSSARSSPAWPRASPPSRSAPSPGQIALVTAACSRCRRSPPRSWPAASCASRRRGAEGRVMRATTASPRRRGGCRAPRSLARALAALAARRRARGDDGAPAPRRPARRCRPRSSTPTATGSSSAAPASRWSTAARRQARPHARDVRRNSPTRTCATRSRPRGCRSWTGPAARSRRRSARRRRSPPQTLDAAVSALNREKPAGRLRHGRHHRQRAAQRADARAGASLNGGKTVTPTAARRATTACSTPTRPTRSTTAPTTTPPRTPARSRRRRRASTRKA